MGIGNNIKRWSLILVAQLSLAVATAQINHFRQIDSLQQLLKKALTDTAKAMVMTTLGQYYFPISPDSGFAYGQKALSLSRKLGWKKGEVLALKAIGSNYWVTADYLKCQDYFIQARDVALLMNDPATLSVAYHALAISYLPLGNTEKGIEYLKKALAIVQKTGDQQRLMGIYHNLADIYEGKGDINTAFSFYYKSLQPAINSNHMLGIAHTYMKLGTYKVKLNDLKSAEDFLRLSLIKARQINEQPVIVLSYIGLSELNRKRGNLKKAIAKYDSAIIVSATFKAKHYIGLHGTYLLGVAELYNEKALKEKNSGDNQQAMTDFEKASKYINNAIRFSTSVNDYVALRDETLLLSNVYKQVGKYNRALEAYKQYVSYRDSVVNIQKAEQKVQHDLKVVYHDSLQYIKKIQEKQLKIIDQQNRLAKYRTNQVLLFATLAIILLVMIAVIIMYRNRLQKLKMTNELQQQKMKNQIREAELEHKLNDITLSALHSQMNPHFIFNVLNTIQSFIYSDNKKAASSILVKFSHLIRQTLDYSRRQNISLEEELDMVRLYLEIEKARFDSGLFTNIIIEKNLPLAEIHIPPLFIQPYVENAFKHGLLHQHGEKQLEIIVAHNEMVNEVLVTITDNGIGRKRSAEINKNLLHHQSFASEANEKRAYLVKEMGGNKINVVITDLFSIDGIATGTSVAIHIKYGSVLPLLTNYDEHGNT